MVDPLLFLYASAELILALHISLSNFVVILVYLRSKHIRTPTNAYIFSLAMTDFLAGALGIPFTVLSVLTRWPGSYYACLAIHLILCVLCTVSTLHLLAMAVDKYLTICLKRFDHQRNSSTSSVRKTRAHFLIVSAWVCGAAIAGLPMVDGFGFASRTIGNFQGECHFTVVVDYRYLVFVIFFGTIILPSVIIAFCYMAIYGHIRREERQIKCLLRASERQRRINARRKLIRILLILVLTYAICWYPLYLINTADLFLPAQFHAGRTLTLAAVVLSHLNCALNPMIYAYGVPGFKHSLRRFLPIKAANSCSQGHSPYTGPPMAMPPKSPFIGYNGMPMGTKRGVAPGTKEQMNGAAGNGGRVPPVGKFYRAVSTMNAVPSSQVADAALPTLLSGKKSTQSLLETRRQQFRHRHDHDTGDEECMENNSETSKCCPNSSCQMQNSTTTETDEQRSESGGNYEGECKVGGKQNCQMEPKSSLESTTLSMDERMLRKETTASEAEEKSTQQQQMRTKRSSIASKMSAWSVRIFNGQWLVRSRKFDEEIAQQKLINNNNNNVGGTILVVAENGAMMNEGKLMREEEGARNGSCE